MTGSKLPPGRSDSVAAGRGERADAVESRRRILAAARELFKEKGVDRASMHEIGRRAGVGQGTLYRHFEHKGALCSELLRERVETFRKEAGSQMENEETMPGIFWLLDRLALFNEENAPLLGAIRDASGGGRRMEMYRSTFYRWLRATVAALLLRAVEGGEIRPDLDVDCMADFLLAALNVDLYLFQRRELGMDRARIVGALHLCVDGLRASG